MTTARDIVTSALRKLSVLGTGQTLTSEMAQDALDALNGMINSWNNEGYNIYTQTRESFSLGSSGPVYTIGPGGDFDTTRPDQIIAAFVRLDGTTIDYPLLLIDGTDYATINNKNIPATPMALWYDGNFPLGNITIAPNPLPNYTLFLYSRKNVTEFATINTDIDLPPGQARALTFNLSIEVAPEYEKEPSPTIKKIAYDSKRNMQVANTRNDYVNRLLLPDVGGNKWWGSSYNIFSGY